MTINNNYIKIFIVEQSVQIVKVKCSQASGSYCQSWTIHNRNWRNLSHR